VPAPANQPHKTCKDSYRTDRTAPEHRGGTSTANWPKHRYSTPTT